MEKLKSSGMFENLKPDEEQKKKIYNRIMEQNLEEEKKEIRIINDNRFSLKNIFYPAAVLAVISVAVGATLYTSYKNNDKNTVPAGLPEASDSQIPGSIFEKDVMYNAGVFDGSVPAMKSVSGVYNINKKYTSSQSLIASSASDSEWISLDSINGLKSKNIRNIKAFGDDVLIEVIADEVNSRTVYLTDKNFKTASVIAYVNSGIVTDFLMYDDKVYISVYEGDNSEKSSEYRLSSYTRDGEILAGEARELFYPESYKDSKPFYLYVFLTVTDDGKIAEAAGYEGKVYLYDTDLNPVNTIEIPDDDTNPAAIGSSGKIITSDMGQNITVYSIGDGELIRENTEKFENSRIMEFSMGNRYDLIYFNWKTNDYMGYDAVNNKSDYLFRPKKSSGVYSGCFTAGGKTYDLLTPSNTDYGFWSAERNASGYAGKSIRIGEEEINDEKRLRVETDSIVGTEVNMIDYASDLKLEDVFVTADNRIMLSMYEGYSESKYYIKELDTVTMTLKDVKCTNRAFLRSALKQTGTGKYDVYYADEKGIYGIEDIDDDSSYDMLLDFTNVNFDFDYTKFEIRSAYEIRNYISGFSVDDEGNIYLETSRGINFRLERKQEK